MSLYDFVPSVAAAAKGVCCTREEAAACYAAIPAARKEPALKALRERHEPEDAAKIKALIALHGEEEWLHHLYDDALATMPEEHKKQGLHLILNPHHRYGMAIRNFLREKGFGEEYFFHHNLDCLYVPLVTEALR